MKSSTPPVLGICAQTSHSGKTTLICRLIPILAQHGIRVAVIKHTHHPVQMDYPGKDSYQIRQAGALQTLVGDANHWALISQANINIEKTNELSYLLKKIDTENIDLVLVEGFKNEPIAKIEVHRSDLHSSMLAYQDTSIIAVVSDTAQQAPCSLLDLNDVKSIADFILNFVKLSQ